MVPPQLNFPTLLPSWQPYPAASWPSAAANATNVHDLNTDKAAMGVIRLDGSQKSGGNSPVEVGSLSRYLHGFRDPAFTSWYGKYPIIYRPGFEYIQTVVGWLGFLFCINSMNPTDLCKVSFKINSRYKVGLISLPTPNKPLGWSTFFSNYCRWKKFWTTWDL